MQRSILFWQKPTQRIFFISPAVFVSKGCLLPLTPERYHPSITKRNIAEMRCGSLYNFDAAVDLVCGVHFVDLPIANSLKQCGTADSGI